MSSTIKLKDEDFEIMPTGLKKRILRHLNHVEEILSVYEEPIEEEHEDDFRNTKSIYIVTYIFNGETQRSTFRRRGWAL